MKSLKYILAAATQILRKLEEVTLGFNIVLVWTMMVLVVYAVTSRYAFAAPVGWVVELSQFMMVALTFIMIAYLQYQRLHVRVSFLIIRQSERTQRIVGIITTLFALAIFMLLLKTSWDFALQALRLGFKSEEVGYPVFPPRLLVPIGSFLMCLQLLADLGQQVGALLHLRGRGGTEMPE